MRGGELGRLRKVVVEYPRGWLATPLERTGVKQAAWRTDPARSGAAGCIGDLGTHAENLAEYVTGRRITEIAADLTTFVDGRRLDDDSAVLVRPIGRRPPPRGLAAAARPRTVSAPVPGTAAARCPCPG